MDDFWKKVYDAMMTPLPGPPKMDLDKMFEYLRSVEMPTIPELPTAPEWMQRYVKERGLDRIPHQVPAQSPVPTVAAARPPQGSDGLWGFLHPEGTGSTQRSFNAIYP